jgi:hypothetical protein
MTVPLTFTSEIQELAGLQTFGQLQRAVGDVPMLLALATPRQNSTKTVQPVGAMLHCPLSTSAGGHWCALRQAHTDPPHGTVQTNLSHHLLDASTQQNTSHATP